LSDAEREEAVPGVRGPGGIQRTPPGCAGRARSRGTSSQNRARWCDEPLRRPLTPWAWRRRRAGWPSWAGCVA